jgi:hypothetical protein
MAQCATPAKNSTRVSTQIDPLPPKLLSQVLVHASTAPGHALQQVHSSWKQAAMRQDDVVAWLLHGDAREGLVHCTLAEAAGCTRSDHAAIMQRVLAHYQPQLTKPLSAKSPWDRWYRAGLLCGALDKAAGLCRVDTWLQLMQHVPAPSAGLEGPDAVVWASWVSRRLPPALHPHHPDPSQWPTEPMSLRYHTLLHHALTHSALHPLAHKQTVPALK